MAPPRRTFEALRTMSETHTTAVEDYLKGIFLLEEAGGPGVTATELAKRLGVTVSAVSGMIRRLGSAGLVNHRRYGTCTLTADGRKAAARILRRRRVIESYLVEALSYGWEDVDAEAENLEHVVSDRLVERMAKLLGYPARDPHGDPIPALDGTVPRRITWRVSDLEAGARGVLSRVVDDPPGLLRWLRERGVVLGDAVEILGIGANGVCEVRVGGIDNTIALGNIAASSLELCVNEKECK